MSAKLCVAESSKRPSLGRHRRHCSVCAHAKRAEIEAEFVSWRSPVAIASEYGLADRSSIYRHAHALDLFSKRQRNVRAALEKIIEKAWRGRCDGRGRCCSDPGVQQNQ
jgi:hypothetical protein